VAPILTLPKGLSTPGNKLLPKTATNENGNKLLPETAILSQHLSSRRFRQQFVAVFGNFVAW